MFVCHMALKQLQDTGYIVSKSLNRGNITMTEND